MAKWKEGAKATSIISIFDRIWVNTIVVIKPILSAIFVEIMNEKAVRTPGLKFVYWKKIMEKVMDIWLSMQNY